MLAKAGFLAVGLATQPFNINTISPQLIRGVEIYAGAATTPATLRTPKTVCGTVAIWTKNR
jgi:hypothetical protein